MNTLTRQEMQGLAFEPQQPEIEQLDLVRYWRAIARNKWRILALVALVGLIATLYAYSLKPIYRSTATVLVEGSRPKGAGASMDDLYIAYGQPQPDQAAIEAAARAARAHEFIVQLPQGYDTVVGDRGVRLSGGQQQRVALARALLKDPPILILDEATAMFDPQGEAEFLQACHDTLRRRTVLLITHRPASLAAADRTVRLEGGRLCVQSHGLLI